MNDYRQIRVVDEDEMGEELEATREALRWALACNAGVPAHYISDSDLQSAVDSFKEQGFFGRG